MHQTKPWPRSFSFCNLSFREVSVCSRETKRSTLNVAAVMRDSVSSRQMSRSYRMTTRRHLISCSRLSSSFCREMPLFFWRWFRLNLSPRLPFMATLVIMTKITTVARGLDERRTKNRSFQMNYDVFHRWPVTDTTLDNIIRQRQLVSFLKPRYQIIHHLWI